MTSIELQRKQDDKEQIEKLVLKLMQYEEEIDQQDHRMKQYEEDMTKH